MKPLRNKETRVVIWSLDLLSQYDSLRVVNVRSLIGKRFDRLRVIHYAGSTASGYFWRCLCDCGNECVVRAGHLISRAQVSCGCYVRNKHRERLLSHGKRRTRIYAIWSSMKIRCCNPNHEHYKDYGGRGIKVCKRWHKFENFYADMGDAPAGMSLDRIDNNGNYCKENCRWSTASQQARNRRTSRFITFRGKTQCLSAWSEETGIAHTTIINRIRRGYPMQKVFEL